MRQDITKIEKYGKIYMLAYDQGLEHGPGDFNDVNYHPNFIIKTAMQGEASCIAMQYGNASKFYSKELINKVPLILKLNGKTNLNSKNYLPALISTPDDAKRLGAVGIGFTINPGQTDEHIAFNQFAEIRRECEKLGLLTVIWSYARGPEITDQYSTDTVSYAVRVATELGADVVKVKYTGSPDSFSWAVKNGPGLKIVASGTDNFPEDYLGGVREMFKSGAHGIAVGRKVWQDKDPVNFSKRLAALVYNQNF